MSSKPQRISPQKVEANRRNAQHSTGPKTPAGKERSSQNALKHGWLAKEVVVVVGEGKEDPNEFDALLTGLKDEYEPVGIMEKTCIDEMATCIWRKRRGYGYEVGAIREHADALSWVETKKQEGCIRDA